MAFPAISTPQVIAIDRMVSRTLLQFRKSPVFLSVLEVFANELQRLHDAINAVIVGRTVPAGVGEQLNGLGRIVGQDRGVATYDDSIWFVPDVNSLDQTRTWVTNGLYLGLFVADDATFRQFIEARIYRNFSRYGSIPEIQRAFLSAYGYKISFVRVGPMVVDVVLPNEINSIARAAVFNFVSDDRADDRNALPIPATVSIGRILTIAEYNTFAAGSIVFAAEHWGFGSSE